MPKYKPAYIKCKSCGHLIDRMKSEDVCPHCFYFPLVEDKGGNILLVMIIVILLGIILWIASSCW